MAPPSSAPAAEKAPPGWEDDPAARPAPLWLRLAVLVGLGVALLMPLGWLLTSGPWRESKDRAAAGEVAGQFLQALQAGDIRSAQPFLTAEAARSPVLQGVAHLQLPFLACEPESITLAGNEASVRYRLDWREEAGRAEVTPELVQGVTASGVRLTDREKATVNEWFKLFREIPFPDEQTKSAFFRLQDRVGRMLREKARQQFADRRGVLYLRREGDRWRVAGIARFPVREGEEPQPLPWGLPGGGLTLPSEQSPGLKAFEKLGPLDQARWESSWKVDLEREDIPAFHILREAAEGGGLRPSFDLSAFRELKGPVTLKVKGTSRLAAIEEVCRRVGLHPEYSGSGMAVAVKAGARPWPAAFAGPFLVTVGEAREFPPQATGVLTLDLFAAGLPASVAQMLRTREGHVTIEAVTAAGGEDFHHAENQALYKLTPSGSGTATWLNDRILIGVFGAGREPAPSAVALKQDVPLRNLLREVDSLHQVKGLIRVPLPDRVDVLDFTSLTAGAARKAGDVRLTLKRFTRAEGPAGGGTELDFEAAGLAGRRLEAAAYAPSGQPLFWGPISPEPDGRLRLLIPGRPGRLVFKAVTLRHVEYPFTLPDVPLRDRTPRRIEPPRFPGHQAPVTVEARGADVRAGLQLILHNHSQKAVERVDVQLRCLDAGGQVLKTVPHTAARFDSVEKRLAVLPDGTFLPGNLPELPRGTKTVEVTVTRVGFADGTRWAR